MTTQQELAGRVALVTGSARGIGRAIAGRLAELGAKVAVNDLPGEAEAADVLKEIADHGGEAMPAPADIRERAAVKAMVDSVLEKWGRVDILVNNAGVFGGTRFVVRTSEADWDTIMDTNLRGAFLCTRAVLGNMLARAWGRVINIASVAGVIGRAATAAYSSSKGGLIAFTQSLAAEVGSRKVTVNAIAPGHIVTRMTGELTPEAQEVIVSRTALKRLGTPREVAELAGFLATDRAAFITGQVIRVDGGET